MLQQASALSATQAEILSRLNRVYAAGEARLNETLESGERGDTLADFIHLEVVEVTQGIDGDAAWGEAHQALAVAERELIEVEHTLFQLPAATRFESLVKRINIAYAMGEGRLDEDLPPGERGDTLADFIRMELKDVCQGPTPALQGYLAIKAAAGQISECLCELRRNRHIPRP